ncbi:MAG TPA: ATP-binding protein [Gemmatimonadaceae bacterium]|nr:ATP-binding protein [Gemmatimonadaceae bacterium]
MSVPSQPGSDRFDPEQALQSLHDGCCVVSSEWRILFANHAFERMLGVPRTDYLGHDLWQFFPSLAESPEAELARATMIDGKTRSYRIESRDPRIAGVYDIRLTPMPDGGLCVQVRDVSESSRFERELADRSEENASLREVARALAEEVDLSAILRLICEEAASQCAAPAASVGRIEQTRVRVVAAHGTFDRVVGGHFDLAGSLTERAIRKRSVAYTGDYQRDFARSAAQLRTFDVGPAMAVPLLAHRQVLGVLLVARPIGGAAFGERDGRRLRGIADHAALAVWKSQLMEQLQVANVTKGEFMAMVSHELRTPLTALTGYEELLADKVLGPLTEQQLGAVERMRTSTQLLSSIIEEILTFSRLEAGEELVRQSEITAQEAVRAAAVVLEPLANEKRLRLSTGAPDRDVVLTTDGDMVRRILVNLGGNAVKFTNQGEVRLEAGATNGEVRFSVKDTGIGIAPENLPRLFQPFTQLESGFTRRFGGTGLGLYISQRLALLLHGRIEVRSELGKGSEFSLVLPRRA